MTKRYALKDDHWEWIKDLLPGRAGTVGVTAKDNRLFVEAVLYRYRSGIPWRDLPDRFGDFRVVHTRLGRWAKAGIWQKVFEALSHESHNEYAMLDSTIVRAHQHSAGKKDQAIGRSKGGLSTKVHARTDALGNPTGFYITAGQAHDLNGTDVLHLMVPSSSPTVRAINYNLKRWQAFCCYLDDDNLPIDMRSLASQGVENSMRPWALGRKNWLFAGSLRWSTSGQYRDFNPVSKAE